MVKGLASTNRRLRKIPKVVKQELVSQLEKEAGKVVALMTALKPIPEIEIGWTWGDAPAGSVTLGTVRGRSFEQIKITIFATAKTSEFPGGFAAVAGWFEHGTKERFTDSGAYRGRIAASPYFFPAWRAERTRVKGNVTRAIKRGFKKAMK